MSTRIKKLDLARDALYEKVNTIADELDDNKVSKSGDKMTGTLTNDGVFVSQFDNVNYIARSKSLVKGTTPTDSNKYVGYDWQDKNGQRLAYLGVVYKTNGTKRLELQKIDNNLSKFNISYNVEVQKLYALNGGDSISISRGDNNYTEIKTITKNGVRTGGFRNIADSENKTNECMMYVPTDDGTSIASSIVIGKNIGGDTYTRCPKPADNSNNNAIATTNWAGGLNRPNTWLASNTFKGAIELSPENNQNHGGYIDFHYNGDTGDYTSRIIESSKGTITFESNTLTHNTAKFLKSPETHINGNARYKSVCDGYTKGTAPATNQFGGISTTDKNGVEVATVYSAIDTNNAVTSALWVKQPTATGTEAKALSIWCDKNGVFHTSCPVQSAEPNSIVTTVSHGTNYVRLGNGIIIQWIYFNNTGPTTWTFPTPFSDTNYAVVSNCALWWGNDSNKKTTSLTITDTNFGDNVKFNTYCLVAIGR